MTPEEKQREERRLLRLFALVYGPIALLVIGIFLFVFFERARIERMYKSVQSVQGVPIAGDHPSSDRGME
jgi:hypothetical protein